MQRRRIEILWAKEMGVWGRQLQKSSSEVGVSDFGLDIPMLPQARRFPSGSEWQHHFLREVVEPDHSLYISLADWRGHQGHKSPSEVRVSDFGPDIPTPPHTRRFPSGSEWRHYFLRVPGATDLLDDQAKGRVKPPPTKVLFLSGIPAIFITSMLLFISGVPVVILTRVGEKRGEA